MKTELALPQSAKHVVAALAAICVVVLTGCSTVGLGVSIPVGPFGSVSVGTSSAGGVSVGAGVGGAHGGVSVGGTIPTKPWGEPATPEAAKENLPAPAPLPSASTPVSVPAK